MSMKNIKRLTKPNNPDVRKINGLDRFWKVRKSHSIVYLMLRLEASAIVTLLSRRHVASPQTYGGVLSILACYLSVLRQAIQNTAYPYICNIQSNVEIYVLHVPHVHFLKIFRLASSIVSMSYYVSVSVLLRIWNVADKTFFRSPSQDLLPSMVSLKWTLWIFEPKKSLQ